QLGQGRVGQVRAQSLQDRGEANEKVRIRFGRRGMLRGGAFEFGEQERELRGDRLKGPIGEDRVVERTDALTRECRSGWRRTRIPLRRGLEILPGMRQVAQS